VAQVKDRNWLPSKGLRVKETKLDDVLKLLGQTEEKAEGLLTLTALVRMTDEVERRGLP